MLDGNERLRTELVLMLGGRWGSKRVALPVLESPVGSGTGQSNCFSNAKAVRSALGSPLRFILMIGLNTCPLASGMVKHDFRLSIVSRSS